VPRRKSRGRVLRLRAARCKGWDLKQWPKSEIDIHARLRFFGLRISACTRSDGQASTSRPAHAAALRNTFYWAFLQFCESYGHMFSLQKLLGKEDKFFGLLEASAEEARSSVQALVKLSKDLDQPVLTHEFSYPRKKDKEITREISAAVYTTFVTAIEREDIEDLSNVLYKIPKTVEKFIERILLAPQYVRGIDFSKQITLLERATDIVLELVKSLRGGMNLEKVKDLNDKLQFIEGEADKHMIVLYKDLYSGKHEPIQVILLKDLYELLEKIIDRCRDAGNVISHVVLKHS
jgi:uncharacterized protein Yka (UPF0111/DUF47 family)